MPRNYRPVHLGYFSLAACAILLTLFVSTAGGSTYNSLGSAGGWDDVEKSSSVSYVLDRSDYTSDLGLSEAQVTAALTSAFSTWASVPGSSLAFTEMPDLGGNYDVTDGTPGNWFGGYAGDSLDQGANYLYANVTFGGWLPNEYFDYLEDGVINGDPSNILGVTWTGKVRGPLSKKPRWIADVFFNEGWTWSLTGDDLGTADYEIDIETVMLHELGHALGLGHEDDVEAVMNSYYTGINRDLYPDDEAGIVSLYPEDGGDTGKGKPPWAGIPKHDRLHILYLSDYEDAIGSRSVPEPASLLIVTCGLAAIVLRRRKRG